MYGVITWALDDYFEYDFREKPLEQIIEEDIDLLSDMNAETMTTNT